MAQNPFERTLSEVTNVGSVGVSPDSIPVTASDTVDDPNGPFRALRADGAGVVKVTTAKSTTRLMAFGAGETRYVAIRRVWLTGTTATGLEGMP